MGKPISQTSPTKENQKQSVMLHGHCPAGPPECATVTQPQQVTWPSHPLTRNGPGSATVAQAPSATPPEPPQNRELATPSSTSSKTVKEPNDSMRNPDRKTTRKKEPKAAATSPGAELPKSDPKPDGKPKGKDPPDGTGRRPNSHVQ